MEMHANTEKVTVIRNKPINGAFALTVIIPYQIEISEGTNRRWGI